MVLIIKIMGRYKKSKGVIKYNRDAFLHELNRFDFKVTKNDDGSSRVDTIYDDKVIKSKEFKNYPSLPDFKKFTTYLLSKLAGEFQIHDFIVELNSTVQQVVLLSDEIDINGTKFSKAFYIVNSTDKTRVLNLDYGLYNRDTGISLVINELFDKRDFKGGVTNNRVSSIDYSRINFEPIINLVKNYMVSDLKLSDIRNVILNYSDVDDINKSNHLKFDFLRLRLLDIPMATTLEQAKLIRTKSEDMNISSDNDMVFNAYEVLENYMYLFSSRDSFIIKNETDNLITLSEYLIKYKELNMA